MNGRTFHVLHRIEFWQMKCAFLFSNIVLEKIAYLHIYSTLHSRVPKMSLRLIFCFDSKNLVLILFSGRLIWTKKGTYEKVPGGPIFQRKWKYTLILRRKKTADKKPAWPFFLSNAFTKVSFSWHQTTKHSVLFLLPFFPQIFLSLSIWKIKLGGCAYVIIVWGKNAA